MSDFEDGYVFVIFGGTGDLSKRKLMPALATLARKGKLGGKYAVMGVARNPAIDDDAFRDIAASSAPGLPTDNLFYHCVDDDDADSYCRLRTRIEAIEKDLGLPGNRVFYLSTPPAAFPPAIEGLGHCGLNTGPGWTRLIIEKPFGQDLDSAIELNELVHRHFTEEQIFRIDHYLGKETVRNLFVFRFANLIFEALWNRDRIASVDILVAEDIGVGTRGRFYERTGALKDIIQNHAMQLISLVGMEPPSTADAAAVRSEKIKLLRSIQPLAPEDVVLGQYAPGNIAGEAVKGYREEDGVAADSETETFAALRFWINNWRWQGVPFLVRTGKRLPRRLTQISVTFRSAPVSFFRTMGMGADLGHPNGLVLRLQPDEGFLLGIQVKDPGEDDHLRMIPLAFNYGESFGALPEAYETLILDILEGDQTLFVHAVETEAAWRRLMPVFENRPPIHLYRAGSWGPAEASKLLNNWPGDPVYCKGLM